MSATRSQCTRYDRLRPWLIAGSCALTIAAVPWLLAPLPTDQALLRLLHDVGVNIGPFGIPGALGAGVGAAASGWGGGRNDPTGGSAPGQHPDWYMMPERRMQGGGDGYVWYPSRADAAQYGDPSGAGTKALPMIYFSQEFQRLAQWIVGDATGTTKTGGAPRN